MGLTLGFFALLVTRLVPLEFDGFLYRGSLGQIVKPKT